MKNKKVLICLFLFLALFLVLSCIVYQNTLLSQMEMKIISFVQFHLSKISLKVPVFITDLAYGTIRDCIIWGVVLLFVIVKKYKDAVIFFLALPITHHLYSFLKVIIARPRPPIDLRLIDVKNYSFPSGHSIMSMILYGLLIYFVYKYVKNKVVKTLLIFCLSVLILLIGFTRIWLGVHFPTDVLAGFSLGICCICVCILIDNFDFQFIVKKISPSKK